MARSLLHWRFFGFEDWQALFKVDFPARIIQNLEFPWSTELLYSLCPFFKGKRVYETHFAFLGMPFLHNEELTIFTWEKFYNHVCVKSLFSNSSNWYEKEIFPHETCSFRWYLMLCEAIPDSLSGKSYAQQYTLLPRAYEVPRVVEEVFKHTLYHLKTRVFLNRTTMVYCRDRVFNGGHPLVGRHDDHGLDLGYCDWSEYKSNVMGIGASRLRDFR